MDAIEAAIDECTEEELRKSGSSELYALLALVKELQTLNESVKLLTLEVKGINLGLPID